MLETQAVLNLLLHYVYDIEFEMNYDILYKLFCDFKFMCSV